MARRAPILLPVAQRALARAGEAIRLARLRRRISAELMAERAGMSRPTLRAIERGDPGVAIGFYANALHALGLLDDLAGLAADDVLGRKLQDADLEPGSRAPRRRRRGDG